MTIFLALLLGLVVGALLDRALARGDQTRREIAEQSQSVRQLVEPLREQLGRVEGQLRGLETERARAFGELSRQVDTVRQSSELLGRETASLVNALRKPQARGQWGEMQLRRVVEHAGMLERCDFDEQATVRDADGRAFRPDLVVRLAGNRSVVVDAKVTLAAYLEAAESTDEVFREQRLMAHARHLREHVDRLADKAYWQQFRDAPEFVVLFVPGEAFLAPALERDPALLEHAYARRVHIATPTTLVSLLRAVAYAWQQQSLTENAQEVFRAGKELCARLSTLGGHVDKLGRSLNTAVTDYNKTVASLERNLLPSARRMADLGLAQDEPVGPQSVDAVASRLVSPELTLVAVHDERLSS
ncbi:MAG: recombination protein RmuC [Actinomycetota bacterium]|jgi:DNA recombination protein RmuC|nr:recombination protein RmuC [Actinomycetota bacterium]